jgi:hypothetical protein
MKAFTDRKNGIYMFAFCRGTKFFLKALPSFICSLLMVATLSCDRSGIENNVSTKVQNEAVNATSTKPATNESKADSIRAGYGVPTCHLGMSVNELGKGWVKLKNPYLSDYLYSRSQRIVVMQKAGCVELILFYYFSPDFEPFLGTTEDKIGAQSKVQDVRRVRGDPSFIFNRKLLDTDEYPGSRATLVAYMEDGIVFQFINDNLQFITIKKPQPNFDYSGVEQDKMVVYVRPVGKRVSHSESK